MRRIIPAALAMLMLLLASTLGAGAPTPAAAAPALQAERCFPETGQCISGRIREFWEQNGGLPVFGFPIGPQQEMVIEGVTLQAQWFERNRLELHPENARPYDVLLGRLGADQAPTGYAAEYRNLDDPTCEYYPPTRLNACGVFAQYWGSYGLELDGKNTYNYDESLALFGNAVTPEIQYTINGKTYTVQFFERARFEYHPENAPPYDVLLGHLGREEFNKR